MNLGPTELIIILVIVLIVFGAGRLPQVFSSLGKGVKEFREASEGNDTTEVSKTTTTTTTTRHHDAHCDPTPLLQHRS